MEAATEIPKMFECKEYSATRLTPHGCGKIYKKMLRISKNVLLLRQNGNTDFFHSHQPCLNCKIGATNMSKLQPETKICPCGQVFRRKEGQTWSTWARVKYCKKHRVMSQYQRNKELEKLGIVVEKREKRNLKAEVKEREIKNAEPKVKQRKCNAECGRLLDLTEENFQRKGDDRFTYQCKRCLNARKRDKRIERRGKLIDIRKPPVGVVILDMRDEGDLLAAVTKWAEKKRRRVSDQILYALETDMLRV